MPVVVLAPDSAGGRASAGWVRAGGRVCVVLGPARSGGGEVRGWQGEFVVSRR